MSVKQRLSASVDADLIEAAEAAVAAGAASSVSAWVNDALRLRRDQGYTAGVALVFRQEPGLLSVRRARISEAAPP